MIFYSWHRSCRFLYAFIEKDGFLGKYVQTFCKQAIEKNQFLLDSKKKSCHFQNLKELRYLTELCKMEESIMGPILFDDDTFKKGYAQSCTLGSIGCPDKEKSDLKSRLFKMLEKINVYIRERYGWELIIVRRDETYLLCNVMSPQYLSATDSCGLKKYTPPQKFHFPVTPEPITNETFSSLYKPQPVDEGCILF